MGKQHINALICDAAEPVQLQRRKLCAHHGQGFQALVSHLGAPGGSTCNAVNHGQRHRPSNRCLHGMQAISLRFVRKGRLVVKTLRCTVQRLPGGGGGGGVGKWGWPALYHPSCNVTRLFPWVAANATMPSSDTWPTDLQHTGQRWNSSSAGIQAPTALDGMLIILIMLNIQEVKALCRTYTP